jgi:hypothetical protein
MTKRRMSEGNPSGAPACVLRANERGDGRQPKAKYKAPRILEAHMERWIHSF